MRFVFTKKLIFVNMGVSSLLSIAILLAVAPFSIGQPGGDGGPPGDDTSSGGGLPPTSSDTGSDAPDCPTNGTNAHYEETLRCAKTVVEAPRLCVCNDALCG